MEKLPKQILIKIFQCLSLHDQLNAAKVCLLYCNLIRKSIFKKQFKNVEIFKATQYYVLSYRQKWSDPNYIDINVSIIPKNRILLKPAQYKEFLVNNAENFETLLLSLNNTYDVADDDKCHLDMEYLRQLQFVNLKSLCLRGLRITGHYSYVQLLSPNYPNLKELCLKNCLMVKGDWPTANTFKDFKMLKILEIVDETETTEISYHTIRDYLYDLNLEKLVIRVPIENCVQLGSTQTDTRLVSSLEELTIGCFQDENTLSAFNKNIFCNLNNLKKLTIIANNNFIIPAHEIFNTLNTACKHLEYLRMEKCNLREFIPVSTLKELEFKNCFGLAWSDLRTILSEMNLKSFTSHCSRYKATFEPFNIKPQLEHISLHYNITNPIKNIFSSNKITLENLSTLNWSVDYSKQLWLNVTNLPNLKTLKIRDRNTTVENLMGFNCLQNLFVYISADINYQLNLSNLLKILQHPSLNILSLSFENIAEYVKNKIEYEQAETNLCYINFCNLTNFSNDMLLFWINLLHRNRDLTLHFQHHQFDYHIQNEFFKFICSKPALLQNIKSINICGLNIDRDISIPTVSNLLESVQNICTNKDAYITGETN